MFEKKSSENLSKIHSEPCQTSKMEIFARIINYQKILTIFAKGSSLDFDRALKMLLAVNVLTHFIKYYLFKVSITILGRGSYKYFF